MRLIKKGTLFGWDSMIWYLICCTILLGSLAIVGWYGL